MPRPRPAGRAPPHPPRPPGRGLGLPPTAAPGPGMLHESSRLLLLGDLPCTLLSALPGRRASPPQHTVRKGAGPEPGVGGSGWGSPACLPRSSRRRLPRRGPGPACEVRTHLGDWGEGGDIGVLRWGPRSPLVLHILIHSIFGTRKGTNISVLNSSLPLPSAPTGSPVAAQSSISAPHCHGHPTWGGDAPAGLGWARALVATLGPCLSLSPC